METITVPTEIAERHAGGTVNLAKIFEIRHNAVSQWGENLPVARAYELRLKRPEWFLKSGKIRQFKG